MRALLCQLSSRVGDPLANAERAAETILSHADADLAVFPELFLSGYTYRNLAVAARTVDDDEIRVVRRAAREAATAVVLGFVERTPQGIANSVALIEQDGEVVAIYRKTQLFGDERTTFVPGQQLLVAPLAGVRVAPLICFDVEFPEPARALAVAGADLIVTSSANMEPFYVDHEVASRARAVENRRPHVYVNAVGATEDFVFVGGSRVVSPLGDVLVELPRDRERVSSVALPEGVVVDERVDYLQALQPLPSVHVLQSTAWRGGSHE